MVSYKFYNILKIQKSISAKRGPIDIDIYNLISNLEITMSGLKRTKSILQKPIHIFSSPKIAKNAV